MKHRCYTYFRIVGKFNTDDISNILNLTPEKKWSISCDYAYDCRVKTRRKRYYGQSCNEFFDNVG